MQTSAEVTVEAEGQTVCVQVPVPPQLLRSFCVTTMELLSPSDQAVCLLYFHSTTAPITYVLHRSWGTSSQQARGRDPDQV